HGLAVGRARLRVGTLGDEQLRHLELAFLGGDVKGRLAQLVIRRKVDPGVDQAGELVEIAVLDRAEQRLRRSLRMRAGASEGERGDERAQGVFHSNSSRGRPDGAPETSRSGPRLQNSWKRCQDRSSR